MNLTPEANPLPPPSPGQSDPLLEQWAKQQKSSKHPPLKVIGIAVAVLIGVGVIGAIGNSDDESSRSNTSTSADASTGNASVDDQLVDAVWESSGKASICPSFNELKATLPTMSEDELFDMGVEAAGGMGEMTPAQVERMRELVKSDC